MTIQMIFVSLVIEQIFIQLAFEPIVFLFVFNRFLSRFPFVFIAIIIRIICISNMFLPFSQTHPTELMFALCASHMVTALILFNWVATLGTHFGVDHDPLDVLILLQILQIPLSQHLTTSWLMPFLQTKETELLTTFTFHFI